MRVLLTGATGQLGKALQASVPTDVQLISLGRAKLDLADHESCRKAVFNNKPDWIINTGAYTAVDKAESQPELAYAINAGAPNAFAEALLDLGGNLLQLSTDFVFSGQQNIPYEVTDVADPIGIYGASKAAGEVAAMKLPSACLLRTGWLYGPVGHNFCLTMLRMHASRAAKGESLKVVSDQIGCPTATDTLALACWRVIFSESLSERQVLHWSDAGVASWYDFAVAIGELALEVGLLDQSANVVPIRTAEYHTAATRPKYSVLNCASTKQILGLDQRYWRKSLKNVLKQLTKKPI